MIFINKLSKISKSNLLFLEVKPGVPDGDIDNDLPETVIVLTNEFGSKVYIVGTTHFSKESQEDVAKVCFNS